MPVKKKDDIKIKTKISPRLQWVLPYLKKAKLKMPSLMMPTQIRSFKPNKKKIMRVLANIYFAKKIIVLATHNQLTYQNARGETKVKKIVALPRHEILDTLAHELAHMRYTDHDYEHAEYTHTIFRTFGLTQKCPTCKGKGRVAMVSKP